MFLTVFEYKPFFLRYYSLERRGGLACSNVHRGKLKTTGFYRQWSFAGDTSERMQINQMKNFAIQIETISKKCDRLIITVDANLFAFKWDKEVH